MAKRIFDIIFSFLGLVILSPFLLLISLLIKLNSKGQVFYRGIRIGKDGKQFRIFKFRTMVENAEKLGGPSTAGDDVRLTKLGKFLKKYQIDELPQLINVLKGEMSFVGPRPEVPFYIDLLSEEERKTILSVPQGMTDYASLWNFHEGDVLKGSADPEKAYQEKIRPEKIKLQIKYVKENSFFTDIKIILKTVAKIFQ
ncbi:MAG: sugar transferase [Candidatus Pacebacteria bacterium]|nr:sugar transferase [Candidatus Paceibacterota bacterium]